MQSPPLPENEVERLKELHALNLLDTGAEERFDRITRVAATLFNVPVALITLVDSDRQWFKSCFGLTIDQTPRSISFCGYTILDKEIFWVEDATRDPRFADNPLVTGEPHIRFYAGCPIQGPQGQNVGTLCLWDQESRQLTEKEMQLLRDVAEWARAELTSISLLQTKIATQSQELKRKEVTFFKLMDGLPVGVFVLDSKGNPYYANQTAQQILGKGISPEAEPEDLPETYHVRRAGTDQEYPAEQMPLIKALDGMSTEVDDMEIHRPDGIMNVQVWGTPVFDDHGQITHAVAAFQDITDRKRTERRLLAHYAVTQILAEAASLSQATPQLLQAICESVGCEVGAIWSIDFHNNFAYCVDLWHSPKVQIPFFEALTRKLQCPPGVGLPGRVWSTAQPAWIPDIVEDANFPRTPAALKDNLHAAFAFPILFRGQVTGIMEFFSTNVLEADEQLLSMFSALGSQIGQYMARKRMEAELEDTQGKLAGRDDTKQ